MLLTTPPRITANIRRLCRKISNLDEPVFVRVSADPGGGLADCFEDVRRQIEKFGGQVQHGWTIWEWPGLFVEAEFHAVWRHPDGTLVDVSPKKDGEEVILFAPDRDRTFKGVRQDNVRLAVSRDPRVKKLLQLQEDYHRKLRKRMRNVPFNTPFRIDGELLSVQKQMACLELELMRSRDARRARGV